MRAVAASFGSVSGASRYYDPGRGCEPGTQAALWQIEALVVCAKAGLAHCVLRMNAGGEPAHPLYLPAHLKPLQPLQNL